MLSDQTVIGLQTVVFESKYWHTEGPKRILYFLEGMTIQMAQEDN